MLRRVLTLLFISAILGFSPHTAAAEQIQIPPPLLDGLRAVADELNVAPLD